MNKAVGYSFDEKIAIMQMALLSLPKGSELWLSACAAVHGNCRIVIRAPSESAKMTVVVPMQIAG